MKKRFLTLLLCTSFTLSCLTGCGSKPSVDNTVTDTSEAAEPPITGWTTEKLLNATSLCGKQLSCPLTINSLGEGFSIGEGTEMVYESSDGPRVDAELLYNNEYLGIIYLEADSTEAVNNDTGIYCLVINEYSDVYRNGSGNISLNGAGLGDSKEILTAALGTPAVDNEDTYTVIYNMMNDVDAKLVISYDDDNKISGMTLSNFR